MAKIRKFSAYRTLERPYTRKSKFRKKAYIRAVPVCKVVRFNMGKLDKEFPLKMTLVAGKDLQIRDNALESARQTSNRVLEKTLGKESYFFRVRTYPHHVLRENALASGAGADRLSTGMKKSFGKTIGIAAQIRKGQTVFEVTYENKNHAPIVKKALQRAASKVPCSCKIIAD